MLVQTNTYIVSGDKRADHERLMRRFLQVLQRLGCDRFEVFEQNGGDWTAVDGEGRFVQSMHFRDRAHHQAVQNAERADAEAQRLIEEFCQLIDLAAQNEQGTFSVAYYNVVLPSGNGAAHPPVPPRLPRNTAGGAGVP